MFKHYFERIQDVEIYPIISLVIFFGFFISLLIWVSVANKKYIHTMKNLPLDLDTESESSKS
ncbi:MAG: cytochrome C oxidase Cbb3 [Microscillaceae bacterium]|nr:cytochrome C oxidase Cbb3 [Microscillaceae bacterium]